MLFFQFLKSLDDLLYELMSWLVFFPVTLWRTITRPLAMMAYADRELSDAIERQYEETLSPPQFLLVSLLVSHAIELALVGQSALVVDKAGLAGLVDDNTSLLFLRLVIFALFPIILSARFVRQRGGRMTRETLREPFYAQCFVVGTFALALGIGTIGVQMQVTWQILSGAFLIVAVVLWFATVQLLWFRRRLGVGWGRALASASLGLAESIVACTGVILMV